MDDLLEEFKLLQRHLIDHYRTEMSLAPHQQHTLPVSEKEVELVKALLLIVGGRVAQRVMKHCWNRAREHYPAMYSVGEEFPLNREAWCKRVVRSAKM